MDESALNNYLTESQTIVIGIHQQHNSVQDLLKVIEKHEPQFDIKGGHEFFKGEMAFFQGQHENALKHYLQAKSIPSFEFFCLRASAYASRLHGQVERALGYAEKALDIKPNDFKTLVLYEDLLHTRRQTEKAKDVHKKILEMESKINFIQKEAPEPIQESDAEPVSPLDLGHYYAPDLMKQEKPLMAAPEMTSAKKAIRELKQLALAKREQKAIPYQESYSTSDYGIEGKLEEFQKESHKAASDYLYHIERRRMQTPDRLIIFDGWQTPEQAASSLEIAYRNLTRAPLQKATRGVYLQWCGKGVAINPGNDFLDQFHKQQLTVRDLDSVIITQELSEGYDAIRKIHRLNSRLNADAKEPHCIHYYLHPQVYEALSYDLKPHFKQERGTVHSLEYYIDSPEMESIELSSAINLLYFPAKPESNSTSALGSVLELCREKTRDQSQSVMRIGYVGGTGWTSNLTEHLGGSDILICEFGKTEAADLLGEIYNDNSLGYHGSYTLIETLLPRLVILTGFDGANGDVRLEVVKKLRQEFMQQKCKVAILPGHTDLIIDLPALKARCNLTNMFVDPYQLRVIKSEHSFGKLQFIAPSCSI